MKGPASAYAPSSTAPILESMVPFAAAAPDNGLTEFDPTFGFVDLFTVLALCMTVGLAVLVAFAVGALWMTIWQEADELGERWHPDDAQLAAAESRASVTQLA